MRGVAHCDERTVSTGVPVTSCIHNNPLSRSVGLYVDIYGFLNARNVSQKTISNWLRWASNPTDFPMISGRKRDCQRAFSIAESGKSRIARLHA